jgi:hypothetical protein
MQRLQQYFSEDDIVNIQKIKPSRRHEEDFIAWFPEKRGLFSVKSAYRLGLNQQMQVHRYGATSDRPDGARPCWKVIWSCPVPPKAKILAWKICNNAISTQVNLARRGMSNVRICQICGQAEEDTFHVFARCPHARALWQAMQEVWELPSIDAIQNTRKEWLLRLLNQISENQRANLLMLLWRIWHAHNEITHDKPCPTIESSRRFLVSYLESLLLTKQFPEADIAKGKMVLEPQAGFKRRKQSTEHVEKAKWVAPDPGVAKLNIDGAYTSTQAGIGMILRDDQGGVIMAACRTLEGCLDATEAELATIEEGLKLAIQWYPSKFSLETDSTDAAELIKQNTPNASAYAFVLMLFVSSLGKEIVMFSVLVGMLTLLAMNLLRLVECKVGVNCGYMLALWN